MKEYSDGKGGVIMFCEMDHIFEDIDGYYSPKICIHCGWGKEIVKEEKCCDSIAGGCSKCNGAIGIGMKIEDNPKNVAIGKKKTDREYLEELLKAQKDLRAYENILREIFEVCNRYNKSMENCCGFNSYHAYQYFLKILNIMENNINKNKNIIERWREENV